MDSINLTYERFKENNDTETFYKRLDEIELSAISNLTDKEEVIILSQTSVSRASTQYWTTKFQKWLDNTNVSTPGYDRPPGYWGNVAKADGKGAVFGGPVTWSAFGVSVAGWAVGSSIYSMF